MAAHLDTARRSLALICGIAGLAAYNWWVLVPFKHGLIHSPDELFSNLEVTGLPYAVFMQRADLTAGLLVLAAFLLAGAGRQRREWLGMVSFAIAGAISGIFPQVCEDGINAGCRQAEFHFQLPLGQYLHDGSGMVEFAGVTLALWFAFRRTRGEHDLIARGYRLLAAGALVAYPVLGLSYLLNLYGAVMEGVFFIGFTAMVVLQLTERLRHPQVLELSSDHNQAMINDNMAVLGQERDGSHVSS